MPGGNTRLSLLLIMQGIAHAFYMSVSPAKLVLDLIGERGFRTTQNFWIPAFAGMTPGVRHLYFL